MKNHLIVQQIITVLILSMMIQTSFATETVWIDVRSESEYQAEHLDGTEFIPHALIGDQIGKLNLAKDTPIKLFCRSGGRAGIAKKVLEEMGYTNVQNVGGIDSAKILIQVEK